MSKPPHHSLLPMVLTVLFLIYGCVSKNTEKQVSETISYQTIEQMLTSGQTIEKEQPFVIREFDPEIKSGLIGNGVSYGCYRKGQAPWGPGPSDDQILEDLNLIKNYWSLIRVYNADNDTERVIKAIHENKLPLKVMLGIWLEKEDSPEKKDSNIKNTLRAIKLTDEYPNVVIALNIGNETQVSWSGHRMESDRLTQYIRAVRNNTKVPVTTADDHMFWAVPESRAVADEIDFLAAHLHPMWNGKTIDEAIPWTDETIKKIKDVHHGKKIVLGETGWATDYNADKKGDGQQGTLIKGEVGYDGQEQFLLKLDEWIVQNNMTVFLFEVFDEPWKGGGESSGQNEVEKHWGLFNEDRTPKASFENYLKGMK
jgi:exo-beta-1,3-glucanase (GH17 family)